MNRAERRRIEREIKGKTNRNQPQRAESHRDLKMDIIANGLYISESIEESLNIKNASMVLPEDIALIGLSSYAAQEGDLSFPRGGSIAYARKIAEKLSDKHILSLGFNSRSSYIDRYVSLIGKLHYGEGDIAQALQNSLSTLGSEKAYDLESQIGRLYGQLVYAGFLNKPYESLININPHKKTVDSTETNLRIPFPQGNAIIEYGPGVSAINRLPTQTQNSSQYFAIDSNWFVSSAINSYAELSNVGYPYTISRMDGIKSATDDILKNGGREVAGLVIASMVFHFAGHSETRAGIENAWKLLAPQGVMAMQVLENVKPGQVTSGDVFQIAYERFGEPISTASFRFKVFDNSVRTAHHLFFRK